MNRGVTIIGLGYIGLVNAVMLASYHRHVIGYDIDKEKIVQLKQGISPIDEDGVQILLAESHHNLRFTSNDKDAIRPNDVIIVAVDTPIGKDGKLDMSYFRDAIESIAKNAIQDTYVVILSTVPIGTNRKVKKYLEEHSKYKFEVITHPEFLSQGRALKDVTSPSRVVIGTDSAKGEALIRKVYDEILIKKVPILVTSPENAEIIKYASNSYLAMRISFINEIARICERVGGNIDDVYLGISLDPRVGLNYFKPGVGFGGGYLPKDTDGLYKESIAAGEPAYLAKAAIESNDRQTEFFIGKIFARFKSITNMKVAVLGLGYKGGTEDIRNSPAIPVVRALLERYAEIYAYDSIAEENFRKLFSRHTHIHYMDYVKDALDKADFVVILSDSAEFKKLTLDDFKKMKHPIIFDGRNLYKPESMVGVEYHSVGRPTVEKKKGK